MKKKAKYFVLGGINALVSKKKKEKSSINIEQSSFFCITTLDALVVSPKTLPYPPSAETIIQQRQIFVQDLFPKTENSGTLDFI